MALPAGNIIRRYGYRAGVLTGLLLYGIGALLFIPGERIMSFEFFLFSLFIIGCGLTCLETAANPYVTVLGEPESAERRINWLSRSTDWDGSADRWQAVCFCFLKTGKRKHLDSLCHHRSYRAAGGSFLLPDPVAGNRHEPAGRNGSTDRRRSCRLALESPELYVGTGRPVSLRGSPDGYQQLFHQLRDGACRHHGTEASLWLSFGGMSMFMAGRMGGSWIMRFIRAERLLVFCGAEQQ